MPLNSEALGALVVRHLAEISGGRCSITEDDIQSCERNRDYGLAQILTGLLYLHQDLVYQRGQLARTNAGLREREAFATSLTAAAGDAIVSADFEGRIIGWNRGAQFVFGYAAEEVTGRPLTVLMPERYREAHVRGL